MRLFLPLFIVLSSWISPSKLIYHANWFCCCFCVQLPSIYVISVSSQPIRRTEEICNVHIVYDLVYCAQRLYYLGIRAPHSLYSNSKERVSARAYRLLQWISLLNISPTQWTPCHVHRAERSNNKRVEWSRIKI